MTVLPLTVLVHEGPSARAYLTMMRRERMTPRRIILMVQSHGRGTGSPIGWWLPKQLRPSYAEHVQMLGNNYWPRRIEAGYPYLLDAVVRGMTQYCDDPAAIISEMSGRFRYERYAERVDRILVRNLRDSKLTSELNKLPAGAILFTGGGIVPREILNIAHLRFLHVHPGLLPDIRGADGLLWSTLLTSRPALSCFYMAAGIDTGEVIATREFPPLRFNLSNHPRPDDQTLYRALFSYCDPILRAGFLVRNVLEAGVDLCTLPAKPQSEHEGSTFHFMHPALRQKVLASIFTSERISHESLSQPLRSPQPLTQPSLA